MKSQNQVIEQVQASRIWLAGVIGIVHGAHADGVAYGAWPAKLKDTTVGAGY